MNTYYQGQPVELTAQIETDGAPIDPSTIELLLTDPSGATTTIPANALTRTGTGAYQYVFQTASVATGTWAYEFVTSGTAQTLGFGYFVVAAVPTGQQGLARIGPCGPWIIGPQVQAEHYPSSITPDAATAAEMAEVATELLYNFSGQQFTGVCGPVKVRPIRRPTDADTRGLVSRLPAGSFAVWGWSSAFGQPGSGAASHYGTSSPPEVNLGVYPVVQVMEVKLDGETIPPDEYYVQDRRDLVRVRTSAAATPTDRFGWPTSQIMDLPDTEPGTFSVKLTYGTPPPRSGVTAALALARELVVAKLGGNAAVPRRITSITRTGESISVDDTRNILQKIPEVQVFLAAFNPSGLIRQPIVWSPDIGRARRVPG